MGVLSETVFRVFIFLAPLCPICQDMTYDLRLLEDEFSEAPVTFVGWFPNASTRTEQIGQFGRIYGLEMPLLADTADWASRLGARWTPEVFVLNDRDEVVYQGRINDRYFAPGRRKNRTRNRDLRNALLELVDGKPVRVPHTDAIGCPIEGVKIPVVRD